MANIDNYITQQLQANMQKNRELLEQQKASLTNDTKKIVQEQKQAYQQLQQLNAQLKGINSKDTFQKAGEALKETAPKTGGFLKKLFKG